MKWTVNVGVNRWWGWLLAWMNEVVSGWDTPKELLECEMYGDCLFLESSWSIIRRGILGRVACKSTGSINFIRGTEVEVHQCVGLWQRFAYVQLLEWMASTDYLVCETKTFEGIWAFMLHVGSGGAWMVVASLMIGRRWWIGLAMVRNVVCNVVKCISRLAMSLQLERRRWCLLWEVLWIIWRLELIGWGCRLRGRGLREWHQVVLMVLWDGVGEGVRWRRLDDVTESHDPRVNFVRVHGLQEEPVEAWRDKVQGVRIVHGCLEIGDKLKTLDIERQSSKEKRRIDCQKAERN